MNLIEKIIHCTENDDVNQETSSNKLKRFYTKLGKEKKDIVDEAFILMCGYKISSILEGKTIFENEFDQ